jgi:hypothetical protein
MKPNRPFIIFYCISASVIFLTACVVGQAGELAAELALSYGFERVASLLMDMLQDSLLKVLKMIRTACASLFLFFSLLFLSYHSRQPSALPPEQGSQELRAIAIPTTAPSVPARGDGQDGRSRPPGGGVPTAAGGGPLLAAPSDSKPAREVPSRDSAPRRDHLQAPLV